MGGCHALSGPTAAATPTRKKQSRNPQQVGRERKRERERENEREREKDNDI